VDQAHEEIPDLGAVLVLVEQRVLAMQNDFLEPPLTNVVVQGRSWFPDATHQICFFIQTPCDSRCRPLRWFCRSLAASRSSPKISCTFGQARGCRRLSSTPLLHRRGKSRCGHRRRGLFVDWGLVQPEVAKMTQVCTYDHSGIGWSDSGPKDSCDLRVGEVHTALRKVGINGPYSSGTLSAVSWPACTRGSIPTRWRAWFLWITRSSSLPHPISRPRPRC
jgi:hypothetical protein